MTDEDYTDHRTQHRVEAALKDLGAVGARVRTSGAWVTLERQDIELLLKAAGFPRRRTSWSSAWPARSSATTCASRGLDPTTSPPVAIAKETVMGLDIHTADTYETTITREEYYRQEAERDKAVHVVGSELPPFRGYPLASSE